MVFWPQAFFKSMKFESPADAGLSNRSNGAEAPAAAFGKTASADFASARYKFENPADAGLSNRSIGAEAPAAAFGKTASADFASAGYKYGCRTKKIRACHNI